MRAELKTKRLFMCPNGCAHEFTVEHLIVERREVRAGPWYCDECGQGWMPTVHADGTVDVEPCTFSRGKLRKVAVTITLPPQSSPIVFKLITTADADESLAEAAEHKEYFYNEHTCPTNWLRDVDEVHFEGDSDPHGLFRFTSVVNAERDEHGRWAPPRSS